METPDWRVSMGVLNVPDYMRAGLHRYIEHGIRPGHFLTAVLCNDLSGAVARADDLNSRALPDYIRFLYNYAPSGSWGSPEKFNNWLSRGGLCEPEPDQRPG